jgi:hypothetical protein
MGVLLEPYLTSGALAWSVLKIVTRPVGFIGAFIGYVALCAYGGGLA